MKNNVIVAVTFLIIAVVGVFVFVNGKGNQINGNSVAGTTNSVQKIVLSNKNFNYYPDTFEVKANMPVEITLDASLTGCLRSFAIRDLGVSKFARTPDDKIVFTPIQKGTFTFSCSMGMGYGKLVVL